MTKFDSIGRQSRIGSSQARDDSTSALSALGPGKRTLVEMVYGAPVQLREPAGGGAPDVGDVHAAAARGVATSASPLPHLDIIQRAFGRHDISAIQAHTGGDAAASATAMGAHAYATGHHVVLGAGSDLHTVAHEAAHIVQQRAGVHLKGGVGEAGDPYERHANAVADRVVAGQSAEALLDRVASGTASASPGGGPVQMYAKLNHENQDYRMSDNGDMAVLDSVPGQGGHDLYATLEIIAAAQAALAKIGSPYQVAPGSETITVRKPGKLTAIKINKTVTLTKVIVSNQSSSGDALRTIEACSSHGQDLLGSPAGDMEHGMAAVVAGQEQRYDKRGIMGKSKVDTEVMRDTREQMTGANGEAAKTAYEQLPDKQRDKTAKQLGVNQFAVPKLGEGAAVYRAAGTLEPGQYPMHFAPVIANSGADYVTLENRARADTDRAAGSTALASAEWFFRMYGSEKKEQSFYDEHVKTGRYGGREGTMTLVHRPVAGFTTPEMLSEAKTLRIMLDRAVNRGGTAGQNPDPVYVALVTTLGGELAGIDRAIGTAWVEGGEHDTTALRAAYQALVDRPETATIEAGQDPWAVPVSSAASAAPANPSAASADAGTATDARPAQTED